jgi:SAM-dependent methyltransferase
MGSRHDDGSAGDANYGQIGAPYADYRRPDPRIAATIRKTLGDATSVLNVGAGAGSYEPTDLQVTAVEPSASMRSQRPPHLPVALDAVAEDLPFPDASFDAAMTTFSIHQWTELEAGLRELRRVTRGPIAILTCDPALLDRFWLTDYAPEVIRTEARRYPTTGAVGRLLGPIEVHPVPIPLDCTDGFNEAYYGRPELLLDPLARTSCSAWSFVDKETAAAYVDHLRSDLASGVWDQRYGHLRNQATFEGSLILIVS